METPTLTPQQKRRIRKLVEALRSGKYKQAQDRLRDGDKFCCLGVACDLYGKAHKIPWKPSTIFSDAAFLGHTAALPRDVYLVKRRPESLASATPRPSYPITSGLDSLKPYHCTIARLIEETYLPAKKKKKK